MAKKNWSPDELGLLAAIHAEPRFNEPRLVYADWLEEHGQGEYAELIRLQCSSDQAVAESSRAIQLAEGELGREWAGWMPDWFDFIYVRGLPVAWLHPNLWTLERLNVLLSEISPRLRFTLMLREKTLFHRAVGVKLFEHPIMKRVERFRICPVSWGRKQDHLMFVRRLASFKLPNTAEEMNFAELTKEAEDYARKTFGTRFRVTVGNMG